MCFPRPGPSLQSIKYSKKISCRNCEEIRDIDRQSNECQHYFCQFGHNETRVDTTFLPAEEVLYRKLLVYLN